MRPKLFTVSYDLTTKVVSAVVCAVLLLIAAGVQNVYLAILSLLVLFAAYAYSARGYAVTEESIVVQRLAGSVRLPLSQVLEARRTSPDDFAGCLRLWGSGGLFGYYGLFRTSRLGRCTWYVTDRKKTVVVRTESKTALFSPDDVEGFLAAIPVSVPASPAAALSSTLQAYGGAKVFRGGMLAGAFGVLVAIGSLTVVAVSARYSPGPPQYSLTPAGLAIHDRFYPFTVQASNVDTSNVRVIDLAQESDWRPAARTGGFSNSHYRSGMFRAKNGRSMRLYWANGTKVVLLPPRGADTAVLMEVPEPEAFVRQVRQEWPLGPQ